MRGVKEVLQPTEWGSRKETEDGGGQSPGPASGGFGFGVRADLQSAHQETQERLPTGEVEIAGESPHVIEEGFAGGQSGAQEAVEVAGSVLFQPALGSGDFAIVLGVAILRSDELGPQSEDL